MTVDIKDNCICVSGLSNFSLDEIFDCGQAFRFFPSPLGGYSGVAFSRAIRAEQRDGTLLIHGADMDDFDRIWRGYFDLDTDYAAIQDQLRGDPVLARVIPFGAGIHILRQDTWEALITFIISQQNNIPRIKKIVNALCRELGDPIEFENETFYTFPSPQRIIDAGQEGLEPIHSGFRSRYILDAADKVSSGEIDLKPLHDMQIGDARRVLTCIKGVGPKVCDCVLLFGAAHFDAFPVDVWMNRIINEYYDSETFDPGIFGSCSGVAQQYLFYYARENKVGKVK